MITRLNPKVPTFTPAAKTQQFLREWLLGLILVLTASQTCLAQIPAEPEPTAEPPASSENVAPAPSRSERDNQRLAQAKPEEALWLQAPGEQVLALHRPTENTQTKGIVLFLHATESPPGWPPAFENPRRTLPHHGWVTLAISLPSKSPAPLPQREEPAPTAPTEPASTPEEATPETATPASPEPTPPPEPSAPPATPPPSRNEEIQRRVDAALAWIRQQDITPIVVVVDNSSVIDSLSRMQSPAPAALILINLQAQEELTTAELEGLFTANSPPILDVFLAPHQGQMTATRKRHRAVALRNKVPVYQQFHLPPPLVVTRDDEKTFWVERLRGFMEQQKKSAP